MIPLQCWPRCKHSGQASHGCQHLLGPPLGPSLGRVSVSRTPLRRPQLPLSGPSRDTRAVIAATREVFLLSRELSVMRLLWECLLCDFLAAIITTLSDSVPSRTMAAAAPSTSPVTPVPPCTATLAPHNIFLTRNIFLFGVNSPHWNWLIYHLVNTEQFCTTANGENEQKREVYQLTRESWDQRWQSERR